MYYCTTWFIIPYRTMNIYHGGRLEPRFPPPITLSIQNVPIYLPIYCLAYTLTNYLTMLSAIFKSFTNFGDGTSYNYTQLDERLAREGFRILSLQWGEMIQWLRGGFCFPSKASNFWIFKSESLFLYFLNLFSNKFVL